MVLKSLTLQSFRLAVVSLERVLFLETLWQEPQDHLPYL